MDNTHEISNLLQYSPKRKGLFEDIKAECSPDSVGFCILCPTRWTVRNETFHSIMENYDALLQLWETMLDDHLDSEVRARVNGVASQMKTFNYFFGACFHYSLLRIERFRCIPMLSMYNLYVCVCVCLCVFVSVCVYVCVCVHVCVFPLFQTLMGPASRTVTHTHTHTHRTVEIVVEDAEPSSSQVATLTVCACM